MFSVLWGRSDRADFTFPLWRRPGVGSTAHQVTVRRGCPHGQPRAGPNAGRRGARASLAPPRLVPSTRVASPPCDGRCRKLSRSHAPESRRLPSGVGRAVPLWFLLVLSGSSVWRLQLRGGLGMNGVRLGEEPVCPEPRPLPRLLRAGTWARQPGSG